MVGQAPPPRRQHPGRLRPRRLAALDLRRAPGREHDTTAARTDPDLLTQIRAWVDDGQLGLADLGYEGEADILRIPIKKSAGRALTVDQQAYNAVHGALRALGERANSLLKTTFKALRRWRGCPGASATSSPPRWSFSTTNTTAQHDHPKITLGDQHVARKSSLHGAFECGVAALGGGLG